MTTWMTIVVGLVLSCSVSISTAKEICCQNGDCYDDQAPFNSILTPLPSCPEEVEPQFQLYTRKNREIPQRMTRSFIPSNYDSVRHTFFIVHGFNNDITTSWIGDIKNLLLDKEEVNVILVGWGKGSKILYYPQALANSRMVAREVHHVAANLVGNGGTSMKDVTCVGHSLGAHACGNAGKLMKFGRIFGLDPAGPIWDDLDLRAGLTKDDADFVETIHTHGHGLVPFGTMKPRGHVDFYPNGGGIQPGCFTYDANPRTVIERKRYSELPNIPAPYSAFSCSHSRAYEYFKASIKNSCFSATYKCDSTRNMPAGCTRCVNCPQFGFPARAASDRIEGLYYMKTSRRSPYCI